MATIELTGLEREDALLDTIRKAEKAVFVFYSPRCPHCVKLKAFLKTASSAKKYTVIYCNATLPYLDAYATSMGVSSVPQSFIFVGGKMVELVKGFNSNAITSKLEKY